MPYKRVLLKLSGSFFGDIGLDFSVIDKTANDIIALQKSGIELGIVNGGGNIFRGRSRPEGFNEEAAHKIGITSTIPNSISLMEVLRLKGVKAEIMSAIKLEGLIDKVNAKLAQKLLSNQYIMIFTAGTGKPFFTTDTGAVQRAIDIKADILLKATDVDGVYSADPNIDKNAKRYDKLTYNQAIKENLEVMDKTAFELAQKHKLQILVFKYEQGKLASILNNPEKGTIIS